MGCFFFLVRSGSAQCHCGLWGGGFLCFQRTSQHGGFWEHGHRQWQKSLQRWGTSDLQAYFLCLITSTIQAVRILVRVLWLLSTNHYLWCRFSWLFIQNSSSCFQVKEYLKVEYKKEGKPREESFFDKVVDDIFHKNDNDKNGQISVKEYNIYKHDEL